MTVFGRNMKLTVATTDRERLHRVLTEGLGCAAREAAPGLVLYGLDDGFSLGVFFVDDEETLTDAQQLRAPWLELGVDDVATRTAALLDLEVEVVPYPADSRHTYFRLPGGPVFRLAPT